MVCYLGIIDINMSDNSFHKKSFKNFTKNLYFENFGIFQKKKVVLLSAYQYN